MAKTLVGLYDTFTDAEGVVQDLVKHDFSRSDIHLATQSATHAAGRTADPADAREAKWGSGGTDLMEELTERGVPVQEASAYAEGVRRGGTLVVVNASDNEAERGIEIMQQLHTVDIDERVAQWREEGWSYAPSSAVPQTAAEVSQQERSRARQQRADAEERTIPVVEEELSVGKREVERGRVRIHSRVEERPVEESVRLREERVIVERHPVDRPAADADLQAAREETIEMTETVEEPVVSKRARVVEEVTVHKEAQERTETVRGTVHRTDVDVEQTGGSPTTASRGFEAYLGDFRQHHTTTFAGSGTYYEAYEPAYRYGYDLGTNERSRGRDWAALEGEARRDWEARQPGTWERFKDAIRYGWDKVRART
jgi:uncharacterized protein (TIGR02271 family)